MKKFTFNLESLLHLRALDEQKAQTALGQVNAQIETINRQAQELVESVESAYESWDGDKGRRFNAMDRLGLAAQVAELKRQTAEVDALKQEALRRREIAMARLREAARNRKVITNLKEARLQEHQAEELKREANEIEDIFNARRGVR